MTPRALRMRCLRGKRYMGIFTIPFFHNGANGAIEVDYRKNTDVAESGFDMFADFDPTIAIGYPMLHGYVKEYKGTGYRTASAWIQIVRTEYFRSQSDAHPVLTEQAIDCARPPFFAFGYPSELFDAPANNLGAYTKMTWRADTFFVTMPARWNDNTIRNLCCFRWAMTMR